MNQISIFIVEDEQDIADLMSYGLEKEGYRTFKFSRLEEAKNAFTKSPPDLCLVDWMLPDGLGTEFCSWIREQDTARNTLLLMVTAKGRDHDVVHGLESGADDYVIKPFSPAVLVARVQALLRRHDKKRKNDQLQIAGLTLHQGLKTAWWKDVSLDLSKTEFGVLYFLASHAGYAFSRSEIVDAVRGEDCAVTDRAVDVQVVGLRKKLGSAADVIETVRGIGYRFKSDLNNEGSL